MQNGGAKTTRFSAGGLERHDRLKEQFDKVIAQLVITLVDEQQEPLKRIVDSRGESCCN
jgi:hypothetical protein